MHGYKKPDWVHRSSEMLAGLLGGINAAVDWLIVLGSVVAGFVTFSAVSDAGNGRPAVRSGADSDGAFICRAALRSGGGAICDYDAGAVSVLAVAPDSESADPADRNSGSSE